MLNNIYFHILSLYVNFFFQILITIILYFLKYILSKIITILPVVIQPLRFFKQLVHYFNLFFHVVIRSWVSNYNMEYNI